MADSKKLLAWLKQNATPDQYELIKSEDGGKPTGLRCLVTQHELPLRLEPVQAHWAGKAFARAFKARKDVYTSEEELPEHFQFHKKSQAQLWCSLTRQTLNNSKVEVEKYISGRKFQNTLSDSRSLRALEIPSDLDFDSEEVELIAEDAEFRAQIEKQFGIKFRELSSLEIEAQIDREAEEQQDALDEQFGVAPEDAGEGQGDFEAGEDEDEGDSEDGDEADSESDHDEAGMQDDQEEEEKQDKKQKQKPAPAKKPVAKKPAAAAAVAGKKRAAPAAAAAAGKGGKAGKGKAAPAAAPKEPAAKKQKMSPAAAAPKTAPAKGKGKGKPEQAKKKQK